MFKWLDRRKHIRREEDIKDQMRKVIADKHKAAKEAIEKMNQFVPERRTQIIPVLLERRQA